MILPNKIIKPIDSLISIGASILSLIDKDQGSDIDLIFEEFQDNYSKNISNEKFIFCLDFLYIVGKVEVYNETIKVI